MGLCKCPKKKVTNHFCFEHKVNVCEFCMTTNGHSKCIVGPYLQWLDDSSYDNSCYLCKTLLASGECVRLCCYHVFHLNCLDQYALQLPPNTAPAGYVCPMCSHQIFSFRPGSTNSPVAGCLEKALTAFTWSREGIGMGLLNQSKSHDGVMDSNSVNNSILHPNNSIDSTNISMPSTASNSTNNPYTAKIIHNMNKSSNYSSSAIPMNTVTSYISTNSDIGFGSTSSMRTKYDDSRLSLLSTVDEIAEDKYRTKSPLEFMFRWLRTRSPFIRNSRTILKLNPYKRMILYIIIFLLLMYLFIHYFLKLARESADEDPFLDPHQDANIRVADV